MDPLPPETSTPMPPVLHTVYEKHLGWPGHPKDDPGHAPIIIKPHITARPPSRLATLVQQLSDLNARITT